jgi:arylesterase / paraoxonase
MACSTQESRPHWLPSVGRLNATGKSSTDYVAVFDPEAEKITRLKVPSFKYPRGLSVHGMDVVQSKQYPEQLLIYLINHREPLAPADARDIGADSVVEIFRTSIGSEEMEYVTTFKDPVIATPNDVVAGDEDLSFYFTNDHGIVKSGWVSTVDIFKL